MTPTELATLVREAVAEVIAEREAAATRPALLDRQGLARALDVSLPTVDRLRREGCPWVRVGDVPRFELEAVLVWLRCRELDASPLGATGTTG